MLSDLYSFWDFLLQWMQLYVFRSMLDFILIYTGLIININLVYSEDFPSWTKISSYTPRPWIYSRNGYIRKHFTLLWLMLNYFVGSTHNLFCIRQEFNLRIMYRLFRVSNRSWLSKWTNHNTCWHSAYSMGNSWGAKWSKCSSPTFWTWQRVRCSAQWYYNQPRRS